MKTGNNSLLFEKGTKLSKVRQKIKIKQIKR